MGDESYWQRPKGKNPYPVEKSAPEKKTSPAPGQKRIPLLWQEPTKPTRRDHFDQGHLLPQHFRPTPGQPLSVPQQPPIDAFRSVAPPSVAKRYSSGHDDPPTGLGDREPLHPKPKGPKRPGQALRP